MVLPKLPPGVRHIPGYFGRSEQETLRDILRGLLAQAPLFRPTMPRTGKPMSVRMTNLGALGWVTDKVGGYRYQERHPATGQPWPAIPDILQLVWRDLASYPHPPEACLVNWYDDSARMGLHQDSDEEAFDAPVVSLSLGNACRFRVGGTSRKGSTVSFRLESGDALVLGGPARLAFHGVDRIYPDSNDLLPDGGRINLTMRRVTAAGGKEWSR